MKDLSTENIYYFLAGFFLILALIFMYLARKQTTSTKRERSNFAKKEHLNFAKTNPNMISNWRKGYFTHLDKNSARDFVTGTFSNDEFCFFDIESATTIIGIKRNITPPFRIEFYRSNTLAPTSKELTSIDTLDLNRNWLVFSGRTEPGITFQNSNLEYVFQQLPPQVKSVWIESDWILASLTQTNNLEIILSSLKELAKIAEELTIADIK